MPTIKDLDEQFCEDNAPECSLEDILESINMLIELMEKEEADFDNQYGRMLNESYYDKEKHQLCLEAKNVFADNRALKFLKRMKVDVQKKIDSYDKKSNEILEKYKDKALNADVTGEDVKLLRYKRGKVTDVYASKINKECNKFEKILNKYIAIKNPSKEDKENLKTELKKFDNKEKDIIKLGTIDTNIMAEYRMTPDMVNWSVKTIENMRKNYCYAVKELNTIYNNANNRPSKQNNLLQCFSILKRSEYYLLYYRFAAIQFKVNGYDADYTNAEKILKKAASCPSKNHLLKDI